MAKRAGLIPKHGGYRKLKTFQLAELVYDVTVRFCDRFIDKRSRTHDQMVQAARSGVQNIVEGSQVSGTSKKMEMKLTNVARGSLEELRRDYKDYLRQRDLSEWPPEHPALARFKKKRCSRLHEVQEWVKEEIQIQKDEASTGKNTDEHGQTRTTANKSTKSQDQSTSKKPPTRTTQSQPRLAGVRPCPSAPVLVGPCGSVSPDVLAANAALSLLNITCYLLDQQLDSQGEAFESNGGFTERLYRRRKDKRNGEDPEAQ